MLSLLSRPLSHVTQAEEQADVQKLDTRISDPRVKAAERKILKRNRREKLKKMKDADGRLDVSLHDHIAILSRREGNIRLLMARNIHHTYVFILLKFRYNGQSSPPHRRETRADSSGE